jgi:hypothetical protein
MATKSRSSSGTKSEVRAPASVGTFEPGGSIAIPRMVAKGLFDCGDMSTLVTGAWSCLAQSAAKGFSAKPFAAPEPPAVRIMSMRARSAAGTCRWLG